jgi:hypothetical protein
LGVFSAIEQALGKSRARKGKSLGRRRRARIRPFLALAQGFPSVHSPVGYGLLDHGSDQGADHVSQKPRSLNFKQQILTQHIPLGMAYAANSVGRSAPASLKCTKMVRANYAGGHLMQ